MENNDLRIFRAVAHEGSITKAAQSLGYVQSNVTARMQHLEKELKTTLFYRKRGMMLTPSGEKLLDYAERILQLLEEAHKALNDDLKPAGRLAIGAYYTVSAFHLPKILVDYHTTYPEVELSLETDVSTVLIDKVNHFQLDCAFVASSVKDDRIVEELVHEDELLLITNPANENLKDICKQPFLMNTKGCLHRDRLENWLNLNGITSFRYMEFNQMEAILRGVIAGLGSTLVPKSAVQSYIQEGKLRSYTLPQEYSLSRTYLIRHKDSLVTSAFSKFMEMLKKSQLYEQLDM
ncbi:LysR family transcriptional regulator [Shimazuella sp. AN120528]|uniref:LysR family transcriptional regulator n=1 Tax=Shimazuella soli TaxID=1892854 RepID=UPI001F102928|nr:LysR family transcriptional regulator [Shimazuella soli]MCH5586079.1 LysR family transcriptional regulator [Shimazuella soli]